MLHTSLSQHLATALEFLLDDKTHAHQFGTCLSAKVKYAHAGITEC